MIIKCNSPLDKIIEYFLEFKIVWNQKENEQRNLIKSLPKHH